jgi:hypothetical protein
MTALVDLPPSPAVNGNGSTFAQDALSSVNGTSTHPVLVLEPAAFKAYLLALVPALLGAPLDELEESLFDGDFEDRVARFSTESGGAIYVSKLKTDLEGALSLANAQSDAYRNQSRMPHSSLMHISSPSSSHTLLITSPPSL